MCGVPRKPAKAAKTGLDARLGPKMWERPLDGFNALRAAPGWLPRTPAGARVPMLSRCPRCQIPEIRLFCGFIWGGARDDSSAARPGTTQSANSHRALKRHKNGSYKLCQNAGTTTRPDGVQIGRGPACCPCRAADDRCARWAARPRAGRPPSCPTLYSHRAQTPGPYEKLRLDAVEQSCGDSSPSSR